MDLDHWSEAYIVSDCAPLASVSASKVHGLVHKDTRFRSEEIAISDETAIDISAMLSDERRVVH